MYSTEPRRGLHRAGAVRRIKAQSSASKFAKSTSQNYTTTDGATLNAKL